MKLIYILKEYSQGFLDDSKFSNRKDMEFTNPYEVIRFIKKDNFYGEVFAYDFDEYEEYNNSDDDLIDAVFECVADSNLTIEDL